jgi:hypothetical protein
VTFHDYLDDDRAPRHFVPSGKMDRLPDGGQFRSTAYEMTGKHERETPSMPAGLRTGRQRKQFELDLGMLRKHQDGQTITAIAAWYDVPRTRVYEGIERCKKLARAQKAG